MAGQGNYPFNTVWALKGRNTLHEKMYSSDTDQAMMTVFGDWFFESPTYTKKWIKVWSGTAWVDLNVGYTPLTGSHWADPDPANMGDALDRIASAVYALRGNSPIP